MARTCVDGAQPRPRLLDLFSGAGGAAMGYHRAGFDVTGVDLTPQPRYPFAFIQADALNFLRESGASGFDAIHASPPCQRYSAITRVHGRDTVDAHPNLIAATRRLLQRARLPFVIENVEGSPLHEPILMLCGSMFGLEVRRHRLFEATVLAFPPFACNHETLAVPVYGHSGAGANRNRERERGRTNRGEDWQRAMGIDWMLNRELVQAIPPAYTEYVGTHLLRSIEARAPRSEGRS